ncbi:MAG: hypothetical protein WA056_15195 [Gallionella sp.]
MNYEKTNKGIMAALLACRRCSAEFWGMVFQTAVCGIDVKSA